MRIGELLTKDDKALIRFAASNLGGDWVFIYRNYLEIFGAACLDEPCRIKKANAGRNVANRYLIKQLEKRGFHGWRESMKKK